MGIGKNEGLAGTFLHTVFENAQQENDRINIKEWVAHPASSSGPKHNLESIFGDLKNATTGPGLMSPTHANNENVTSAWSKVAKIIRLQRNLSMIDQPGSTMDEDEVIVRNRSSTFTTI